MSLSMMDLRPLMLANTDLVINVTGMTGTMATGALTPTNYFAV